jgi:ketosteroid isomerase-like protein
MPALEQTVRSAYRAFNARDIDAAVELMHPDVDWPNAWEGGRVVGRDAVREYWARQFTAISAASTLSASQRSPTAASRWTCTRSSTTRGRAISSPTRESNTATAIADGLIVRMDVLEEPTRE